MNSSVTTPTDESSRSQRISSQENGSLPVSAKDLDDLEVCFIRNSFVYDSLFKITRDGISVKFSR